MIRIQPEIGEIEEKNTTIICVFLLGFGCICFVLGLHNSIRFNPAFFHPLIDTMG